jgi:hypothetical protein
VLELGRSVELVRPGVELDEGVRQPALTANDLEPVALQAIRSGSTLAKRLALHDEPVKPLLQLVDAHGESMAFHGSLSQAARWRLTVRFSERRPSTAGGMVLSPNGGT